MKCLTCILLAGIDTFLFYALGGWDIALQCLLLAIALDYISGLIKAYYTKTLSSKQGFKGILKKIGYLILVSVAVIVDRVAGNTGAIRSLVIYYFVANEGLSVIENLAVTNIPIPAFLKNALKVLKKGNKK